MKKSVLAASVSTLALAIGSAATPAIAAPVHHESGAGGLVFVQNDDPTGNRVFVYHRAEDGSLKQPSSYSTGGRGGILDGSVVDHLASQGSLTYDRATRLLYAVNAGSDTLTVFSVQGDRLIRRQVISSGGSFPVSVAVHGNRVYVLNARNGGSLQSYLSVLGHLVTLPNSHRRLGLEVTTGADEFTHTPGHVVVSPDGSSVIVTTKAAAHSILVYGTDLLGRPSAEPAVTNDPGNVPFAATFDRYGHLVVAEAGPNAVATFALGRNRQLNLLNRTATGQAATCWVVGDGTHFYASNAGSGSLSGYKSTRSGVPVALGNTSTGAGTVDAAVSSDRRNLYVQTGKAGGVDTFKIGADGALTKIGSTAVPNTAGAEGIATN